MTFEEWWYKKDDDLYVLSTVDELREFAEESWQAAQAAERERTTAIMLKHLAQWNVPWSESVDKALKEINELDT